MDKMIWHTIIGFATFMVTIESTSPDSSAAAQLAEVGEEYWRWALREYPVYATKKRVHDYDHLLEEFTFKAWENRKNVLSGFLQRLERINPVALNTSDRRNLAVFKDCLKTFIDGYEWRLYGSLNPMNFMKGMYRGPPSWIFRMPFNTGQDYRTYEERLRQLPRQINQTMELMKQAIRLGRTNHKVSMKGVTQQLHKVFLVHTPTSSTFFIPYLWKMNASSIPFIERAGYRRRALHIIRHLVHPAFRNLRDFLENVYMNNTRPGYGVGSFYGGKEYYAKCLKYHISLNMSAEEIRDIGLREVRRISLLVEKIMRKHNFTGTLPEFYKYLRTEKTREYYNRTKDDLLNGYRHIVFNRIQPNLHKAFKKMKSHPLSIRPMPSDGPPAGYGGGIFFVNLKNPQTRPSFTMLAVALHEASPGHHLMLSSLPRLKLPKYRSLSVSGHRFQVPFTLPRYTAYIEGWGLYAEFLGEEMKLYNESLLENLGRYSYELARACRLVVDTGIHAFGMSREAAIEYMANYTAMPRAQIAVEVDRYITFPGQACAYKVGELKILELRRRAQRILGSRFDQRVFHEEILNLGRVPLQILEEEINTWINSYGITGGAALLSNSRLWATSIHSRTCAPVVSFLIKMSSSLACWTVAILTWILKQ